MDYEQPDFYRFNKDSLDLVTFILDSLKFSKPIKLLDIGAGCGVIGLELSRSMSIDEVIFIENQKEFKPFLESNILHFFQGDKSQVIIKNFEDFEPLDFKPDLIVSNPPYFLLRESRQGHNELRNNCRHISEKSFINYFVKMHSLKTSENKCLFVSRKHSLIENLIQESKINEVKQASYASIFEVLI